MTYWIVVLSGGKNAFITFDKKDYVFKVYAVYKGKKLAALNYPNTQSKIINT